MNIWGCNCSGDPVGESAQDVVAAMMLPASREEQQACLQKAQEQLVRRVCRSCWPKGESEILWVQTYVEPEETLDDALKGTLDGYVSDDWFLHRAAGIAMSGEEAVRFYRDKLIPKLKDESLIQKWERPQKWISNLLTNETSSPVVRFWLTSKGVQSDPSVGRLEKLYECLFEDGRAAGEYLHVAYPCRGTALSRHVGPAGSYLFLQNSGTFESPAWPKCLVFHLRAFVQALVTAQLWALSQHMLKDLRAASEPFALHEGHFRTFLHAAQEITRRVDTLSKDTSDLYALKLAAGPVFEAKGAGGTELFHSYDQVKRLDEAGREHLGRLLTKFESSTSGSSAIARQLKTALGEGACLEDRWVLARSCYKLTLSFYLLSKNRAHIRLAIKQYSEVPSGATDEERKRQSLNAERYRAIATVQLVEWADRKLNEFDNAFEFEYAQLSNGSEIRIKPPTVEGGNLQKLLDDAKAYVDSSRQRADSGGNDAREWARVIRGLAGTEWSSFKSELSVRSNVVIIPLTLVDWML